MAVWLERSYLHRRKKLQSVKNVNIEYRNYEREIIMFGLIASIAEKTVCASASAFTAGIVVERSKKLTTLN